MRRYIVPAIVIILIMVGVSAYHYTSISYKRVEVYIANNFQKESSSPVITIGSKASLKVISRAVSSGKKIDGILDVASPDYIIDIYNYKNRLKTIYLWLDSDSIKGMYMYTNKTVTGYTITEESTKQLKEIILIKR